MPSILIKEMEIMNKKIMKNVATLTFASVALLGMQTASASWIDWTSTTAGTMDIGGNSVGVTLAGPADSYVDGDYYYNNNNTGGTSATGTYLGLAPSDMIRVIGPSTFTLSFDQTVTDLMMALVSVGKPDILVTYDFNDSFTASAAGNNYWGTGSYAIGAGDTFIGSEYNGVLNFSGSFDSISFSTAPGENWHGFNFASYSTSVPEPAPLALLALGLAGLGLSRRKAK
jgi:hypothetical protein